MPTDPLLSLKEKAEAASPDHYVGFMMKCGELVALMDALIAARDALQYLHAFPTAPKAHERAEKVLSTLNTLGDGHVR